MNLFDQFNNDTGPCGPDCACHADGDPVEVGFAGEDPFPGVTNEAVEQFLDALADANDEADYQQSMAAISALSRIVEVQTNTTAVLAGLIARGTGV